MSAKIHIPVMLSEVIKYLKPQKNEHFIDCTLGLGGHAEAILTHTAPAGKLLGIDLDPTVLKLAQQRLKAFKQRVIFVNDNFANLEKIVKSKRFSNVAGILFDLGLCRWHLTNSGRGFSFNLDEPLDMRFNPHSKLTAYEIVNFWPEKKLIKILKEYGEEKYARRIAHKIISSRPIKTTKQLVEVIWKATPPKYHYRKIHPATRTFQALRITVNQELANLQKALQQTLNIASSGGRLVVISFHSLEDRIVKKFMKENKDALEILTKKPVTPSKQEVLKNPSARSAKLRAAIIK